MGYAIQRFIAPVDPNLICGICANVLENAVTTPCGHSFCQQCLETWLESSESETCPACRTTTLVFDLIPALSLRGLVGNLYTCCDNADNGCKMVVKHENLASHGRECEFSFVKCGGCAEQVKRCDLAEHHASSCNGMKKHAKSIETMDSIVDDLTKTVTSLETDLKATREALALSQEDVQKMERDLHDLRNQFNLRESEECYDPDWDPDYNYGYSPQSISQLSRFIARHLLSKPFYVDRNRIFTAIKRCYDFYHNYPGYTQDVHMLVATCFASNWFNENRRKHFDRWLATILGPRCSR